MATGEINTPTNKPNDQEIDDALAWLERINTDEDKSESRGRVFLRTRPPSAGIPTWLRHDLKLQTPPEPVAPPPAKEQQDNLSWLDSIANGNGAALDETPTLNWADTQALIEDRPKRTESQNSKVVIEENDMTIDMSESPFYERPIIERPIVERPALENIISDAEDIASPPVILEDDEVVEELAPTVIDRKPYQHEEPAAPIDTTPVVEEVPPLPEVKTEIDTPILESAESTITSYKEVELPDEIPLAEEPKKRRLIEETDHSGDLTQSIPLIPDDPDEAIAWLEKLAREQRGRGIPLPQENIATEFMDEPLEDLIKPADKPSVEAQNGIASAEKAQDEADSIKSFLEGLNKPAKHQVTEFDFSDSALPPHENNGAKPTAKDMPDDLNEALAWLEDLVGGSDTPLDEMTVELDEMDVAALLNEAAIDETSEDIINERPVVEEPPLPELPEVDVAEIPVEVDPPVVEAPTVDAVAQQQEEIVTPNLPELPEIQGALEPPKPMLEEPPTEPSTPEEIFADELTFRGTIDQDDLDEALNWLESFAEDDAGFGGGPIGSDDLFGESKDVTVIDLYTRERKRARDAFRLGNFAAISNEFTKLLARDDAEAAEVVVADVSKMQELSPDRPILHRILGDAHMKLKNYEEAARCYRKGLMLVVDE